MKNIKIITAVLLIFLLVSSCGPEPEDIRYEFTIYNVSSYPVKLAVFGLYVKVQNSHIDTTFFLSQNSEIVFNSDNFTLVPFGAASDSVYIVFDNNKQIIYMRDDGNSRNILLESSYSGGNISDYCRKYEYFITDEDYANAVEIE